MPPERPPKRDRSSSHGAGAGAGSEAADKTPDFSLKDEVTFLAKAENGLRPSALLSIVAAVTAPGALPHRDPVWNGPPQVLAAAITLHTEQTSAAAEEAARACPDLDAGVQPQVEARRAAIEKATPAWNAVFAAEPAIIDEKVIQAATKAVIKSCPDADLSSIDASITAACDLIGAGTTAAMVNLPFAAIVRSDVEREARTAVGKAVEAAARARANKAVTIPKPIRPCELRKPGRDKHPRFVVEVRVDPELLRTATASSPSAPASPCFGLAQALGHVLLRAIVVAGLSHSRCLNADRLIEALGPDPATAGGFTINIPDTPKLAQALSRRPILLPAPGLLTLIVRMADGHFASLADVRTELCRHPPWKRFAERFHALADGRVALPTGTDPAAEPAARRPRLDGCARGAGPGAGHGWAGGTTERTLPGNQDQDHFYDHDVLDLDWCRSAVLAAARPSRPPIWAGSAPAHSSPPTPLLPGFGLGGDPLGASPTDDGGYLNAMPADDGDFLGAFPADPCPGTLPPAGGPAAGSAEERLSAASPDPGGGPAALPSFIMGLGPAALPSIIVSPGLGAALSSPTNSGGLGAAQAPATNAPRDGKAVSGLP